MVAKINTSLFIFCLMIMALFVAFAAIGLPASISSSLPTSSLSSVFNMTAPSTNYGISGIMPNTCMDNCAAGALDCIGFNLCNIGYGAVSIIVFIIMLVGLLIFLIGIFGAMTAYFLISGISLTTFLISPSFPAWLGIPLSILLVACNLLVVYDIILIIVSLFPTK